MQVLWRGTISIETRTVSVSGCTAVHFNLEVYGDWLVPPVDIRGITHFCAFFHNEFVALQLCQCWYLPVQRGLLPMQMGLHAVVQKPNMDESPLSFLTHNIPAICHIPSGAMGMWKVTLGIPEILSRLWMTVPAMYSSPNRNLMPNLNHNINGVRCFPKKLNRCKCADSVQTVLMFPPVSQCVTYKCVGWPKAQHPDDLSHSIICDALGVRTCCGWCHVSIECWLGNIFG